MSISPQGYTLGGNPENINPFWGEDEETNWTIDAEATIDSSTGSPSVDVEAQTDTTLKKKTFVFSFKHLKGEPGTNGTDGTDGVSPTVTTENIQGGVRVTITDETGAHSFDIMNGTDGRDGTDGNDGYSPTVTTQSIDGGIRITITDKGGDHIFDIMNGVDGTDGVGVPTGGTTGQVLVKKSNTNYDTEWADGGTGNTNIVELSKAEYTALEQAGTLDPDTAYFINDEDPAALGTAAFKDYTDRVRPNDTGLVMSHVVYSAINSALSSIYTPRGNIDCADLTSAILIDTNIGNVYETNDSGTTSALFMQGAGHTINAGDNVGIVKAGADTILFNLMGNAFDLTGYQKTELTQTIQGASTVEGALTNLASQKAEQSVLTALINNIKTITSLVSTTVNSTSYKSITLGDYSVYLVIVESANSVAIQNVCFKSQGRAKLGYVNPTTNGMGSIEVDFTNSRVRGVDLSSYDLQYGVQLYIYGII